jgi:hypothetical protein
MDRWTEDQEIAARFLNACGNIAIHNYQLQFALLEQGVMDMIAWLTEHAVDYGNQIYEFIGFALLLIGRDSEELSVDEAVLRVGHKVAMEILRADPPIHKVLTYVYEFLTGFYERFFE